jgi:hypothetical protein
LSIRKTALPTMEAEANLPSGAERTYRGVAKVHSIASESLDGSVIVLEDGSRWLVSPIGTYTTVLWRLADQLTVLSGNDPGYPYQLIDARDGSSSSARFLGFSKTGGNPTGSAPLSSSP